MLPVPRDIPTTMPLFLKADTVMTRILLFTLMERVPPRRDVSRAAWQRLMHR